ncbi:MAG: diaminopimelate epimerase [Hyphomicrobiales bacterium]
MDGNRFYKMNGAGNEIVMLDLRNQSVVITPEVARAIANHEGAFFDQLMVLKEPRNTSSLAYVDIWNNDGSRSGACGNGTRCIAAMELNRLGIESAVFETDAGLLDTVRAGDEITVDMGEPKFNWQDIPLAKDAGDTTAIGLNYQSHGVKLSNPSVVNMGNPHAIFWVEDVAAIDLADVGPELEHHELFPELANISLAQVISRDHILLKVWERGAGQTRACGSAACAVAVASARLSKTGRDVRISLPGGDLKMLWRGDNHVLMTGPWELEHEGVLPAAMFAQSDAA